ncbi:hypothetical protein BGZ83_011174 [Gryganskiella cystojenkinii]|nr:hypothetical protein BGZ83_011174 [Gryganskiella cystojenkinii]
MTIRVYLARGSIQFRTIENLPSDSSVLRPFSPETNISHGGKDIIPGTAVIGTAAVESVNRYDLILLMVNMTDKGSWDRCQQALLKMDPGWLLGKCAIVVTRVAAVSKYAFDRDEITDFLDTLCEVPRIWTNLEQDSECALAAAQVVRMLEIGGVYRPSRTVRRAHTSSLSSAAPTTIPAAIAPLVPTATSLSSSRLYGSALSHRMMASHLIMRSPDKYSVESTTLLEESTQEQQDGDVEEQQDRPEQ